MAELHPHEGEGEGFVEPVGADAFPGPEQYRRRAGEPAQPLPFPCEEVGCEFLAPRHGLGGGDPGGVEGVEVSSHGQNSGIPEHVSRLSGENEAPIEGAEKRVQFIPSRIGQVPPGPFPFLFGHLRKQRAELRLFRSLPEGVEPEGGRGGGTFHVVFQTVIPPRLLHAEPAEQSRPERGLPESLPPLGEDVGIGRLAGPELFPEFGEELHIGRPFEEGDQMVDHHRLRPALGHDPLADAVRNVGVDFRDVPPEHQGGVGGVQSQLFAGEPFAGAVAAQVDKGVRLENVLKPQVYRRVLVGRREGLRVDEFVGIPQPAPHGLGQDRHVPPPEHGDDEVPLKEHASILPRLSPLRRDAFSERLRQFREQPFVDGERKEERFAARDQFFQFAGGPGAHVAGVGEEGPRQFLFGEFFQAPRVVSLPVELGEDPHQTAGDVEAACADVLLAARAVVDEEGDFFLGVGLAAERDPLLHPGRRGADPVGEGLIDLDLAAAGRRDVSVAEEQRGFDEPGKLRGHEAEGHGKVVHAPGGIAPLFRGLAVEPQDVEDRQIELPDRRREGGIEAAPELEGEGKNPVHEAFPFGRQQQFPDDFDLVPEDDDRVEPFFFAGAGQVLEEGQPVLVHVGLMDREGHEGSSGLPEVFALGPLPVLADRGEMPLRRRMRRAAGGDPRRGGGSHPDLELPADDPPEHVAEIFPRPVPPVGFHLGRLLRGDLLFQEPGGRGVEPGLLVIHVLFGHFPEFGAPGVQDQQVGFPGGGNDLFFRIDPREKELERDVRRQFQRLRRLVGRPGIARRAQIDHGSPRQEDGEEEQQDEGKTLHEKVTPRARRRRSRLRACRPCPVSCPGPRPLPA